jgi:hypothetical protein
MNLPFLYSTIGMVFVGFALGFAGGTIVYLLFGHRRYLSEKDVYGYSRPHDPYYEKNRFRYYRQDQIESHRFFVKRLWRSSVFYQVILLLLLILILGGLLAKWNATPSTLSIVIGITFLPLGYYLASIFFDKQARLFYEEVDFWKTEAHKPERLMPDMAPNTKAKRERMLLPYFLGVVIFIILITAMNSTPLPAPEGLPDCPPVCNCMTKACPPCGGSAKPHDAVKVDTTIVRKVLAEVRVKPEQTSNLGKLVGLLQPLLEHALPKMLEPEEVALKLGKRFLEEFVAKSGENTSDFLFELIKRLAAGGASTNETPQSDIAQLPSGAPSSFVVRFDYNDPELAESGRMTALEIARVAKDNPDHIVILIGSADRSGEAKKNKQLGAQRAHLLAEELQNRGVIAFRIFEFSRTEKHLPVTTIDGMLEPENRRVDVIFY